MGDLMIARSTSAARLGRGPGAGAAAAGHGDRRRRGGAAASGSGCGTTADIAAGFADADLQAVLFELEFREVVFANEVEDLF